MPAPLQISRDGYGLACLVYQLVVADYNWLVSSWQLLSFSFVDQTISPESFVETLKLMEHRYGAKDFETSKDTSLLSTGTFYLVNVDSMYRRYYAKKGAEEATCAKSFSCKKSSLANGH
ncbi:hypothetical protein BHE74_00003624 [Ensete ventricosum]|uniref:Uncharacterized protein n=1 Tax=Ensete ventricosum TaxID=4639 RepID=A0A427A6R0_ENSVE|nr:hypothetical protein B296_00006485 [Ensete ventricosum]RWW25447.1 hypothetical protein GW17_00010212 [Ensete ventricosum]RWW87545.1 hypothetical protein BHE74_00003624 [Ensete ventricosum]RZR85763.1 hypothetical protein BHM03_00012801 [Ensete ventricosum]